MEDIWNKCLEEQFKVQKPDLRTYSPLTLAYIGDGIYDLLIRTILVYKTNTQVNKLHRKASELVKAQTQSAMIQYLIEEEQLSEEEEAIYKRGRNAFSPTRAKNASMSDYRRATGFEALMGYLYMKKEMQRLTELVRVALEGIKKEI